MTKKTGRGEEERTVLLDDQLLAIGYAPTSPIAPIFSDVLLLAWPVESARLGEVIDDARAYFFPSYGGSGLRRLEFWLENVFYEELLDEKTSGLEIVQAIQRKKITARDRLQLVRYGYDSPAFEWTFDDSWSVTQAVAIVEDVRLRGLVPCMTAFHAHPGARVDKETILLALSEPGQMTGALHLLRPGKVIP